MLLADYDHEAPHCIRLEYSGTLAVYIDNLLRLMAGRCYFPGSHLANGGEGNDKLLGTNFFVGYRVCVSEGKIQLWRHRYDEHLPKEMPYDSGSHVSFRIIAAGNVISVRTNDEVIIEYQDPVPIMYGSVGFLAKTVRFAKERLTKHPKPYWRPDQL